MHTQQTTQAGELVTEPSTHEVTTAELRIDVVGEQYRIRVMRGDQVISEVIRWSLEQARVDMRAWLVANRPDITGGLQ